MIPKHRTDIANRIAHFACGMHAAMNEITWSRVQQWEALHRNDCQKVVDMITHAADYCAAPKRTVNEV